MAAVSALILIVEDEAATSGILKEILEAENFKVLIAPTAFRARGLLEKSAPDLIILDRRLPDDVRVPDRTRCLPHESNRERTRSATANTPFGDRCH